jgi:hypothetical protein
MLDRCTRVLNFTFAILNCLFVVKLNIIKLDLLRITVQLFLVDWNWSDHAWHMGCADNGR